MSAGTAVGKTDGASGLSKRWLAIAAAIAAIVVAVAAVLYFTGSPKLIKADKLAGLLLTGEQISVVLGAPMNTEDTVTGAMATSGGLSRAGCLSAMSAAQELSYIDSGYTDLRWREARDNPENVEHYVVQAVAAFPDADHAQAYVANAAATWRSCADQVVVTVKPEENQINWRLAGVIGVPPKISISGSREDVKWTCQRALRAAANVVVDVAACADQITDQGRRLGDEIAARITK